MIAAGSYPGIHRPEHGRSGYRHPRQEPDRSSSAPSRAADRRNRARSGLLRLNIGSKQLFKFGGPTRTPRERPAQDLRNRDLGVAATGIDGEARSLGGKPLRRLGKSKVVPSQVHEISGIFTIMDRKGLV